MIDVRAESIIYQSQVYYTNLVNTLVEKKKYGKALDSSWDKANTISGYLEALNMRSRLTDEEDILQMNYILECLIILCELNQFPISAPITFQPAPAVIVGEPGPPGDSVTGPQGPAGLATDFQESLITVPIAVDAFDLTDAKGARWDYVVIKSTLEQRAGSIVASWLADGSAIEFFDTSTGDISGSTADLSFDVQLVGSDIQLIATPASGSWTVIGTRYFIPNNGNGSGPVSDVLADGTVFIGNSSNQAQSRTLSGAISVTNTGVTSFNAGQILDSHISGSAAIALSKLAAVTTNRLLLSNGAGQIIASSVTDIEAGYLSGVTSSIQSQLNSKLTDPMTTIGDLLIRDGSNATARLGIGSSNQVLTVVGGVPTWQNVPGGVSGLTTGYLPKASSSTTLSNSIISEATGAITIAGTTEIQGGFRTEATGAYLKKKVVNIGDWNMDSTVSVTVAHGLADFKKIRAIDCIVRNDSDTTYANLLALAPGGSQEPGGSAQFIDSTNITLVRKTSGTFDSTSFDSTSYNRGWVTITYEA